MSEPTYWNGERCKAVKCIVVVGKSDKPKAWYADLVGTQRAAVEVVYGKQTFYLDNEDGSGWRKVTTGKGMPGWGHDNLTVERVVQRSK